MGVTGNFEIPILPHSPFASPLPEGEHRLLLHDHVAQARLELTL